MTDTNVVAHASISGPGGRSEVPVSASPSEKDPTGSVFTPTPEVVREQLERLVAHPLFVNSKRYPVLLTHVVEQAIRGNTGGLKERTIGVDAFGREPDYDVALDPVVRTTAAEVRKRLCQYYYDPDHAGELVVELPLGSYVPFFRAAPNQQADAPAEPTDEASTETVPKSTDVPAPCAAKGDRARRVRFLRWILAALASLSFALVGYGVAHLEFSHVQSNLEAFWEPITTTSGTVTYCLGEPALSVDVGHTTRNDSRLNGSLAAADVTTLARSLVAVVSRGSGYRVVTASETGFAQLREGPFVLIGAFDNLWTMRITQDLPLGFEYSGSTRKLVDRKHIPKRSWSLEWPAPGTKNGLDYALVARIHDRVTGQPAIILAGIFGPGTEAASEVVSNPAYLAGILDKLPKDWRGLNVEAVIETRVIERHPGPPRVLAVETW